MNFKELLKKNGVKQSELAKKLNVSRCLVYYWCKGTKRPKLEIILKISDILNESIEAIVLSLIKTKNLI